MVLIDPPFEQGDEFETLARQMKEWRKRWATGVYLLWYPLKAHLPVEALKDAARALALPHTFCIEALVAEKERPEALNGCGLIVANPPFTLESELKIAAPALVRRLTAGPGANCSVRWVKALHTH